MNISISSEIDLLKSIIIHQPGFEHYFMTPSHLEEWLPKNNKLIHNPNYLLFDDLINTKKAINEHNQLSNVLKYFTGEANCIEIIDLISDILINDDIKHKMLIECLELEKQLYGLQDCNYKLKKLINMKIEDIIFILLTGRGKNDYQNIFFKHPIPNMIFTRDIATVIGSTLVLSWGCREVRRRENIIAKYIFKYHNIFSQINVYDFHQEYPNLSLEGGDIIVFNKDIILIGMSERTNKETINALLPLIFNQGFKKVFAINLPKCRSIMHLDTVFNRINSEEVIIFPPLFTNSKESTSVKIYSIQPGQTLEKSIPSNDNLLNFLINEEININPVKCGGENEHNQIREQWTEGANFFTIKPGVIIGYDCNHFTIKELEKSGYTHVPSEKFILNTDKYKSISKLAITMPCSELSRGRGGARCLTLPLMREAIDE